MKRKCVRTFVLFCALICLMGASSVSFDAGQPNPNPGGVLQKLEGKGTYVVDPGEIFLNLTYNAKDTTSKQISYNQATSANGKWDKTLDLVKGNYDCYGHMLTADIKTGNNVFTRSPVVNATVK